MIENIELKYKVGALLYSPALNRKVADSTAVKTVGRISRLFRTDNRIYFSEVFSRKC